MSVVVVHGDAATTTAVALASAWPASAADEPHSTAAEPANATPHTANPSTTPTPSSAAPPIRAPIVLEADPGGGSLAAWLDTPAVPSLSTAVTASELTVPILERLLHHTPSGVRVLPAPVRTLEAARAVTEAEARVVPLLAPPDAPLAVVDTGRARMGAEVSAMWRSASAVVLVHRQASPSARAAVARVERYVEMVERTFSVGIQPWLVVIGSTPFDPGEIFAEATRNGERAHLHTLPDDPLAAAVYAGRTGVSLRRFARLPLNRAARRLAAELDRAVSQSDWHGRSAPSIDLPDVSVNGSTP